MLSRHAHEESGCTNRLHLVQAGRTLSHFRFLDLHAAHALSAYSLSDGVFAMVVKSQLAAQRLWNKEADARAGAEWPLYQ